MAAHRLVGNGREDEQRGAYHQCEHADVKEQGAGNVHLAHPRPVEVGGVAGQEGITKPPGAQPRGQGHEHAGADPAAGVERQMGLNPGCA